MSLSLTKPSGWAFGELLTSVEMEALDASQAQAIDGTGGGTYTPSATIIINGAGLKVNNLTVTGTLTLLGNETIGNSPTDTLSVLATSTFSAPVTFNNPIGATDTVDFSGNFTVHSGAVSNLWGNVQIGLGPTQTLDVEATATANAPWGFNDTVDMGAQLTVHSGADARLWGNVELGGDNSKTLTIAALLISRLNFGDGGIVPFRLSNQLGNGDQTITVTDGNVFHLPHNNSALRSYTLSSSGAQTGDFAVFYQGFGSNQANDVVIRANGLEAYRFAAGTSAAFLIMFFRAGAWETAFAFNS